MERSPITPSAIALSLALASCAVSGLPAAPPKERTGTFTAAVIRVTDGDTLIVRRDGVEQPVHLSGADCPELGQAFGKQARQFTAGLVAEQEITVTEEGRNKAGAIRGTVTLPDGRPLHRELVRAGLCWWDRDYVGDGSLPILEAEAHAAQRGLWADREPIPPWKWRSLKVKPIAREKEP